MRDAWWVEPCGEFAVFAGHWKVLFLSLKEMRVQQGLGGAAGSCPQVIAREAMHVEKRDSALGSETGRRLLSLRPRAKPSVPSVSLHPYLYLFLSVSVSASFFACKSVYLSLFLSLPSHSSFPCMQAKSRTQATIKFVYRS